MTTRLYVVCGEPGVGKSEVASFLGLIRTNTVVLRTDEIRKELFGPDPDYTSQESQATYDEMFQRARNNLEDGGNVIMDATFMYADGRQRAKGLASETDATFHLLRIVCDEDTVIERIKSREDDASDAGVDVYRSIRDRFEPVEMSHSRVDNSGGLLDTMKGVVASL